MVLNLGFQGTTHLQAGQRFKDSEGGTRGRMKKKKKKKKRKEGLLEFFSLYNIENKQRGQALLIRDPPRTTSTTFQLKKMYN